MRNIDRPGQVKLRAVAYDQTTPLLLGTMLLGALVVTILMFV